MGNTIGGSDGMGNFFDIDTIVDKLTAVRQKQIQRLQNKETLQTSHLSIYTNLQTFLTTNLQNDLTALQTAFQQMTYQAVSSNTALVATAVTNDQDLYPTTHTLTVSQLAQAQTIGSTSTFSSQTASLNINETLSFTIGSNSFTVQVNPTDSLQNIRDNINQDLDNIGVTAAIMTTTAPGGGAQNTLIISSNQTGTANAVTIGGDTGNQFQFTNVITAAQDALFKFDGLDVDRASNYIDDVIDGLSFTLQGLVPLVSPVTITVNSQPASRNAAINTAMTNMINDYNTLLKSIDQDRSNQNTRDDTLSLIKLAFENAINTPYAGSGATITSLWQLGILVGPNQTVTNTDGSTFRTCDELTIDGVTLPALLVSNFSAVEAMIMDPNTGLINNMNQAIQQITQAGGAIDGMQTQINSDILFTENKIEEDQSNLGIMQDYLRSKFLAANDVIRHLEQMGNFLELQLKHLNFDYSGK